MKKITLVASEKEKARFVSQLKQIGVLHVQPIKTPTSHEIHFIEDKINKLQELLELLKPYEEAKRPDRRDPAKERDFLDSVEPAIEDCNEKKELEEKIKALEKEEDWFRTWGEIDTAEIKRFREKGVHVHLYRVNKQIAKKIQKTESCHILKTERSFVYIALVSMDPEDKLGFKETPFPDKSLEQIYAEIDEEKRKVATLTEHLKERARNIGPITRCVKKLKKEHETLIVKFGMKDETKFSYLQGFCPEKKIDKIINLSNRHGLGYVIEDPDKAEETPTLITNPKWINIIKPVFQFMNTIPGYNEFDISFVFLLFFSLFFAMLIGDAGYGMVFLAITFFAKRKLKTAPREPFFLLFVLSGATILWGAVTGTWFGLEGVTKLPFFSGLIIQKLNSFSDNNQNFIIYICFIIGAVHLTIAHIMRMLKSMNSLKALAEVGWIAIIWGMFFGAGTLVLAKDFPDAGLGLLFGGIITVLFFSNPQRNFLKGALSTLSDLPLSVISAFGDVVSYLRLFAVGYASVVLASTFNDMALAGGIKSIAGGIIAAVILFLGHLLNIVLGMMAVVVHGIRLNMLEFSGHLGMQWSGRKYDPFREKE